MRAYEGLTRSHGGLERRSESLRLCVSPSRELARARPRSGER
jgi:hypothetical protein